MKTLILAALAATVATPAVAADNDAFTGVRIGATAGVNDINGVPDTTDVVYGADIGIDTPLGDNFVVGVEAFSENPFDDERVIGAAARVGYAVNDTVMPYVRAGYTNYQDVFERELDGLTVGGGLEFNLHQNLYTKVEYRYSDFDNHSGSHGAVVGVGLRF